MKARILHVIMAALNGVEAAIWRAFQTPDRPASNGFVFATTGPLYTTLARRAARTLRAVMPDAQIDLFTDQTLADPVFSQIHPLDHAWFRPKMEALRRSRFRKTVYLDADVVVLADVSELFALLDRADIAATQGWARIEVFMGKGTVPRAFPLLNAGVIALRKSRRTARLLIEWEARVRTTNAPRDQGCLRDALYDSGLPFIILPPEYNLIYTPMLDVWDPLMGAPRILHFSKLHHSDPGNPEEPLDAMKILMPHRARRLQVLLRKDADLRRGPGASAAPPTASGGARWKRAVRRALGRWDPLL